jgi:nucleoside-diphosphate-sugar epimerase
MATLITGGTGFIGAEMARVLLANGETDITLFDLNDATTRLDDIADKVKVVRGDVGNYSHVLEAIRDSGAEVVFHMGSMLSVPSDADPAAAFRANAMGTFQVLEACRLFGVRQMLFASSIGTYGDGVVGDQIDDLTLQRPRLFYGACKLFGENMGSFYRNKYGLDYRGLRYPPIVGPGVRSPGVTQYISWSIEESFKGKPFTVWVEPGTKAPVLYFKDAARAMVMLSAAPVAGIETVTYLLAGVEPTPTAGELVTMVREKVPGAAIDFRADKETQLLLERISKPLVDANARREWDWAPAFGLEEMVDDFLAELRQHPQRYG